MAITCPIDLDVQQLRNEVMKMYEAVAMAPSGEFHFHRGPVYAAELLGYDHASLSELPPETTASFAGVANPHVIHPLARGETVLDIGSGSGTDLLLAAKSVGSTGRAIGVDFTEAMRSKATSAAKSLGLHHVEVRSGDALDLPVENDSIDAVISNGVLNLVPDKDKAFREVLRVLRPGGRFQLADIVVASELSEKVRRDIDLWTG